MADPPGTFTSISGTSEMQEKLRNLREDGEMYSGLLWRAISQNDPTMKD